MTAMTQPRPRPKSTRPRDPNAGYTVLGRGTLDPEEEAYFQAQVTQADAEHPQDGVTMRWPASELLKIKQAARRRGMDYETFIRQAALESAVAHAT